MANQFGMAKVCLLKQVKLPYKVPVNTTKGAPRSIKQILCVFTHTLKL